MCLLSVLLSLSFCAYPYSGIETIPFIKNRVITINASLFNVTEIQFDSNEVIKNIQSGDMSAWIIDVDKSTPNILFIKPTIDHSNTNMTVVTDQRTYYFKLNSQDSRKNLTYAIKFRYPNKRNESDNIVLPPPSRDYHWDYSFHGSTAIMPLHVFDDGQFTYFQLRPGQAIPAIFAVDSRKGEESLVNFRKKDGCIVVDRLAPQFTLRSGKHYVASIFNNRLIRKYR